MPAEDKPGAITPVTMDELRSMEITSSEPTGYLRFVKRYAAEPKADKPYMQCILQQKWRVHTYRGGLPFGVSTEWRDLPLEVE